MSQLLRFPGGLERDPAVEAWLREHPGDLGAIARHWFDVIRGCGDDVRELLHDGHPTACIGDAAFAYVNAFTNHVNVGFFRGAELPDPDRLLEGTGRFMRHVKLRPDESWRRARSGRRGVDGRAPRRTRGDRAAPRSSAAGAMSLLRRHTRVSTTLPSPTSTCSRPTPSSAEPRSGPPARAGSCVTWLRRDGHVHATAPDSQRDADLAGVL